MRLPLRLRALSVTTLTTSLVLTGAVLSTRPPSAQAAPHPVASKDHRRA